MAVLKNKIFGKYYNSGFGKLHENFISDMLKMSAI